MAIDVLRSRSLLPLLREGRPDAAGILQRRVAAGGVAALVLAMPLMPFLRHDWVSLGIIYVMVGLSINILIGYAGQVSLGHQAFVGVGAFTAALIVPDVTSSLGSFTASVVVAMATGAAAAALLGIVALRLQGLFLALITLAYGAIAEHVLFSIPKLTGGGAGSYAPRPAWFKSELSFVYLCMVFLGLLLFLDWRLMKSKAGRAILAIRENEIAAASFGINVVQYKLFAFVLSGAFAGIAGALFAARREVVVSVDFDFTLALTFVLMTVVGGLGSRAGIFIGAAFFAIFPLAFNRFTVDVLIAGPLLLLFTLTMYPGGIGQQLKPITEWLNGKPFSMKHDEGGVQSGGGGVRP